FATAPGQYAYDALGDGETGKSSVFTRNLVADLDIKTRAEVEKEGLADIAQNVRDLVVALSRASDKSQVPTYYDQLAQRRNIFGIPLPRRQREEEIAQLQKPIQVALMTPKASIPTERNTGEVFSDNCPDCPQMVVIPAGPFVQGSPENEWGHKP